MKCFRFLSLTALLLSLQLVLTSCHGPSPFFFKTAKYVNEKDQNQVLELVQDKSSLRLWVHGYEKDVTEMGHYSVGADSPGVEKQTGKYVLAKDSYVLHSANPTGKESHLSVQADTSLRDDAGNTWRLVRTGAEVIPAKLKRY